MSTASPKAATRNGHAGGKARGQFPPPHVHETCDKALSAAAYGLNNTAHKIQGGDPSFRVHCLWDYGNALTVAIYRNRSGQKETRLILATKGGHRCENPQFQITGGQPLPIYRKAGIDRPGLIFLTPEEGTACALDRIGAPATASPLGHDRPERVDFSPLDGRHVAVLAIRDDARSRRKAAALASHLGRVCPSATVKLLAILPPDDDGRPGGEGRSREAWRAYLGTAPDRTEAEARDELVKMANEAPAFDPTPAAAAPFDLAAFRYDVPPPASDAPLDTALWAIECGFWPVPIHETDSPHSNPGKAPIGDDWGLDRPTEQSIRAAFRKRPRAGVGLKLGAESGIVDIDVDDPEAAAPTLARMFPDDIPPTGGWNNNDERRHMVFQWDDRFAKYGRPIIAGKNGDAAYPGIEIRIGAPIGAQKQYQSVVPPSGITEDKGGGRRAWNGNRSILPAPESLFADLDANVKRLGKPGDGTPSRVCGSGGAGRPTTGRAALRLNPAERARKYLEECEPAVSGQGGHSKLFKVTCNVGPGFDLSSEETFALLLRHYNPKCQPPWAETEIQHKVNEAFKTETRRGWMLGDSRRSDAPRAEVNGHGQTNGRHDPEPGPDGGEGRSPEPAEAEAGGDDFAGLAEDVERIVKGAGLAGLYADVGTLARIADAKGRTPGVFLDVVGRLKKDPEFTRKDFDLVIAAYKPATKPKPPARTDAPADPNRPTFSNYREESFIGEDGNEAVVRIALTPDEMTDWLRSIVMPGWPKRVDTRLFLERDGEPIFLDNQHLLMAMIAEKANIQWNAKKDFVSDIQFLQYMQVTLKPYRTIERVPHYPPRPDSYYMHPEIPEPAGHLDRLIDFFRPATKADRTIIKAAFVTPAWGGEGGQRPAFLFSAPDDAREAGRGSGKSIVPERVSILYGGQIQMSANADMEAIKTRILSPGGESVRIIFMDNIKSFHLSSAELEAFITSSEISGRRNYKGEGRVPNYYTLMMTVNGPNVSKDIAQRVIPGQVSPPEYSAEWNRDSLAYLRDNRWEIFADILAILRAEPGPMKPRTRWASWEQAVLSKLEGAEDAQALIARRRGEIDGDNDEGNMVLWRFRDEIGACGHNPDTDTLFLSNNIIAYWLYQATNERRINNKASAHLGNLKIPQLVKGWNKRGERGWIWTGEQATPLGEKQYPKVVVDLEADAWLRPNRKSATPEPRSRPEAPDDRGPNDPPF